MKRTGETAVRIVHASIGLAAVLAACAAVAAVASAEPLAVKTGLWEVTATGGGGSGSALPQIPAEALAKLSPEQQAMVQQRMAAAGGGLGGPMVRQVCVTAATLQKGFGGSGVGKNCTRTVVSSSATALELHLACAGERQATGSFRVQVADAETVNGAIDLQITAKGGTALAMHRTLEGHWVAADCGGVKPPPGE
jgi:hypothetical protein